MKALPGSAGLMLVEGVAYLDPASAAFTAMLDGWEAQQLSRYLRESTIGGRLGMVRRFANFTNAYPWQWQCADGEDFIASLRSGPRPIALSTARTYEMALQLFMSYVTDSRYGWAAECLQRFGVAPAQIFHEFNTVAHVSEFEGDPHRRPLSYDEVQALFDAADELAEHARSRRRKGVLTAMRDAAFLKAVYAFGLRRREAVNLDLPDLRHNPDVAQYGSVGGLFVRFGKASAGGAPKRRTVLTVPEMDWVVPVVQHWLTEIRPLFGAGAHPALWVTERGDRLSLRAANEAFSTARDAAGLDPLLDLHCLRHSYVTHLTEFGYPEKFVQDQVGHAHASTTAIYSNTYPTSSVTACSGRLCPNATVSFGRADEMKKRMGFQWNLRLLMAQRGMFATTDLVPLLAERGVHLSREQVFRLVTQPPQRLSMDTLAALCDILECTPNDLIEVQTVSVQVPKRAGAAGQAAPAAQRTVVRRPKGLS